ncbi:SGNH hydrolase-type esterase domain-containing protein [Peziza echinospora]|nr:SGNH hydrolase-type esterase domain-containing protein [Peziza echinospora]
MPETETTNNDFVDYDKVMLFGDSITEGAYDQNDGFAFAAALQHYYGRKLDVLGRGFSGYNTAHALKVFPRIIPPTTTSKIKILTIFFGANDACVPGQYQHVPLDEYKANLKKLAQHQALGDHRPHILLVIPPPVCEYKMQIHDMTRNRTTPSRFAAITKQYADAALEVSRELNIVPINLWGSFMEYAGWREGMPLSGSKSIPQNEKLGELLRDGLHFTPKGYQLMYRLVVEAIERNYPELRSDAMDRVFPPWETAPK